MKQFVFALIFIVIFAGNGRSQWLHHERLGHYSGSFVFCGLNLFLLGSLLIKLFFLDNFSQELHCIVIRYSDGNLGTFSVIATGCEFTHCLASASFLCCGCVCLIVRGVFLVQSLLF